MDDVRQELLALRADMARQQARITELEGRLGHAPAAEPGDGATTRRQLLAVAAAAVAGGAAGLSAPPAEAADGNPLILGAFGNTATSPTKLVTTSADYGFGVSDQGVNKLPQSATIFGHTRGNFDTAVLGFARGSYLSGVWGRGGNTGFGVVGDAGFIGVAGASRARNPEVFGVGVYGTVAGNKPKSIGVLAQSSGTALVVDGVLRASRAGVAVIRGGANNTFVEIEQITNASLVFAMLQERKGALAVKACQPRTEAPTGVRIWLNGTAPAGGVKVGWVVIDRLGNLLSATAADAGSEEADAVPNLRRLLRKLEDD